MESCRSSTAAGSLSLSDTIPFLKPQGVRGHLGHWWLDQREFNILYRGQPEGAILSSYARQHGVSASRRLYGRLRTKLTDEELAGYMARYNDESIPKQHLEPRLHEFAGLPIGSVGIPSTRIPGIAREFAQSPDSTIYIIRSPIGVPAKVPEGRSWYPVEQEWTFFNSVKQKYVFGTLNPIIVPWLRGNEDGLLRHVDP
jgi:hypothetical protein